VLSRGGGTSLAGECTNTAVVLDWSKHCTAIEAVDVEGRTAVVQPGLVLDVLNAVLEPHGCASRRSPRPTPTARSAA
jgi:FAD/FMN-containing dehydrogenase